jgi:hypothetical protein
MKPRRNSARGQLFCAWLSCCALLLCAPYAAAQSRNASVSQAQQQQNSPDQLLKLGFFYYNNDDITDKAATQFRAVMSKYPKSDEAETAQYYLGSYYQRKYYIELAQYRKEDNAALASAKKEYRAYTDKYYKGDKHQWLGDAFFNLALVFLQMNDPTNAGYELEKMNKASSLDGTVYLYEIIYSPNADDVIDGSFQTGALADYASSVFKNSRQSFTQKVAALKQWCRSRSPEQAS